MNDIGLDNFLADHFGGDGTPESTQRFLEAFRKAGFEVRRAKKARSEARSPREQTGADYDRWADIFCEIQRKTGHNARQVVIGTIVEEFDGLDFITIDDPEALRRVANLLGSSGDANSRKLAKMVLAAVEGWDPEKER